MNKNKKNLGSAKKREKPRRDPKFDPLNVELSLSPDEEEIEAVLQSRISVALTPLKIEQSPDPYAGLLVVAASLHPR